MNFRVPALALAILLALGSVATERLLAQDDPVAELAALKRVVEEQGKQIEALSAQVAQLVARLEGTPSPTMAAPDSTSAPVSGQVAPLVAKPLPVEPEPNVYVIERGDSLEKIAKSCGTTTAELQKLNNISDPNKVRIGQKIILPAGLAPKEEP